MVAALAFVTNVHAVYELALEKTVPFQEIIDLLRQISVIHSLAERPLYTMLKLVMSATFLVTVSALSLTINGNDSFPIYIRGTLLGLAVITQWAVYVFLENLVSVHGMGRRPSSF